MNTELLEEVRQQILSNPNSFHMNYFFDEPDIDEKEELELCDTVGCLCGWTAQIAKTKRKKSLTALGVRGHWDTTNVALRLLKITVLEGEALFHRENWPQAYQDKYNEAPTAAKKARITSELLKQVIKKREIWWASEEKEEKSYSSSSSWHDCGDPSCSECHPI